MQTSWAARYNQANRHVLNGRRVIARQRELIGRQKALAHDTRQSEMLLALFERSQVIFEGDLSRIGQERAYASV
jgi:hypothetical protein